MAHAETSLFVIASKSGSTIEPNTMAAEARRRVVAAGHTSGGRGSSRSPTKARRCTASRRLSRFRDVFVNPSDIGGRYSALSLFGMVPAALMGIDLDALVAGARAMEAACRLAQVAATIRAWRWARSWAPAPPPKRARQADAAPSEATRVVRSVGRAARRGEYRQARQGRRPDRRRIRAHVTRSAIASSSRSTRGRRHTGALPSSTMPKLRARRQ